MFWSLTEKRDLIPAPVISLHKNGHDMNLDCNTFWKDIPLRPRYICAKTIDALSFEFALLYICWSNTLNLVEVSVWFSSAYMFRVCKHVSSTGFSFVKLHKDTVDDLQHSVKWDMWSSCTVSFVMIKEPVSKFWRQHEQHQNRIDDISVATRGYSAEDSNLPQDTQKMIRSTLLSWALGSSIKSGHDVCSSFRMSHFWLREFQQKDGHFSDKRSEYSM